MIERNHQPFVLPGFKRRRQLLEESEPGSIPLYDSYTRVALSQWTADLSLKLIHRLNGVPSGRPEEREQRRRRLVRVSFHGEREGRVGIVGRLRLVDADIGQHGCASAVAMRLTRDLRARHAEVGGWRRASNSGKLRQPGGERCDDVIQRLPRSQPAPAFLDRLGRQENLGRNAAPALRCSPACHLLRRRSLPAEPVPPLPWSRFPDGREPPRAESVPETCPRPGRGAAGRGRFQE